MIEQRGYEAFRTYPALAGTISPPRPIDVTTGSIRVTLHGTFTARVQVSNAQPGRGDQPHLFLPPETSWETHTSVTETDPPVMMSAPIRWIRIIVDSGSVTGGNVEESSKGFAEITTETLEGIRANTTLMQQAAGVGRVATEAGLIGQPANPDGTPRAYEIISTNERLLWDGAAIVPGSRGPMLASYQQVTARNAPNAADVPGTTDTTLRNAMTAMLAAGATRLDLPPRQYMVNAPIQVDHDLHLRGAGAADWLNNAPAGTILSAANNTSSLLYIIGHPYVQPTTGTVFPQTRIGAYSFEGVQFEGQVNASGLPLTPAALRFDVGNGPVRPVSFDHTRFKNFQTAIDVQVAATANTGIGQVTFNNCVFTQCGAALRGRGNNSILQATFLNVTMEQGARIDVEQGDVPGTGPGAMGGWQFIGGQFEGQADAIKIYGGSWEFFMTGTYFEHNSGRTIDLKASSRNSRARIYDLHVEHAPINIYLESFGRVDVDTHPEKVRVHVQYNGAGSRYHGIPVIPTFNTERVCLTLADPVDAMHYGGDTQPGSVYNHADYPDVAYTTQARTPYGVLKSRVLPVGVGPYSFITTAVTTAQTAVVTALVRARSGAPSLGYVVINATTGAVLSNQGSLLPIGSEWAMVLFAINPAADVPNLKLAFQVANGLVESLDASNQVQLTPATGSEIEVSEMWCEIVPMDTGVHHWRPRQRIMPQPTPAADTVAGLKSALQAAGVLI